MLQTNSKEDRTNSGCGKLRPQAARTSDPVLLLLHQHKSCAGAVGFWLRHNGYRLDIRRPTLGEALPDDLSNHSGVVVFGGPMSANDETDDIHRELQWMQKPLEQDVPFFGICLGAQLMVRALGGEVTRHPEELVEIGYCDVTPTEQGQRLLPSWPGKFFQFHKEGFSLPTGCTALATGNRFDNQAYSHGRATYGVQFHPEITELMLRRWSVNGAHMLKEKGAHKAERLFADHLQFCAAQRVWLQTFMDHWTSLMAAPRSRPHLV